MPIIPDMTLDPNAPVSNGDIYSLGLFAPSATPDSLEILNGGLDSANLDATDRIITPRVFQMGSFAMGFSSGFEREEKVFATQIGSEPTDGHEGSIHAALSHRLFIPFAPSCFIFGYQAWFQQDAVSWDIDGSHGGPTEEKWCSYLDIDGVNQNGTKVTLPFSQFSTKKASTGTIFHNNPEAPSGDFAEERRWRFVSKTVTTLNLTKGYHDFRVRITADLKSGPHALHAKCKTVVGSFFALAIR